jgi:tRNA-guanine family transglycosylase
LTDAFFRGRPLKLPSFVPSISSVTIVGANSAKAEDILKVLHQYRISSLMISVYDVLEQLGLFHNIDLLSDCTLRSYLGVGEGTVLFLDSGGYELQRYGRQKWFDLFEVYSAQMKLKADALVALDTAVAINAGPEENARRINLTIDAVNKLNEVHSSSTCLIGVAHGYDEKTMVESAIKLASIPSVSVVAIPAKEPLGHSLIERLATVVKIHESLSANNSKVLLHILGAGDISLLPVLSLLGADLFDSTNWIDRVAVESKMKWTALTEVEDDAQCSCNVCGKLPDGNWGRIIRTNPEAKLMHNLEVSAKLMEQIRTAIKNDNLPELAWKSRPDVCSELESKLGRKINQSTFSKQENR